MTVLLELFWSFFQIGLFSVGGGYAAMPLIQHQVVDLHGWMTMQEFIDIITISQMTPGPIAINSATFVGIQIAGLPGAIIATLGCVFPSCVIVLTLAWVYFRYRNLSVVQVCWVTASGGGGNDCLGRYLHFGHCPVECRTGFAEPG